MAPHWENERFIAGKSSALIVERKIRSGKGLILISGRNLERCWRTDSEVAMDYRGLRNQGMERQGQGKRFIGILRLLLFNAHEALCRRMIACFSQHKNVASGHISFYR